MSVLKPFGVWVVISPFNFPMALSGAPIARGADHRQHGGLQGLFDDPVHRLEDGRALCRGRPARRRVQLRQRSRRARSGQELQDNPDIAGWTFTGSYDVGMQVARNALAGRYPRPAIIEMGGKNPTIVSRQGRSRQGRATGVARSAFGLDGQKCSACSRVYVEEKVYDQFVSQLVEKTAALKVGNPSTRDTFMGTVIDKGAYEDYQKFMRWPAATARCSTAATRSPTAISAAVTSCSRPSSPACPKIIELVKNELLPAHSLCRQGQEPGRGHGTGPTTRSTA